MLTGGGAPLTARGKGNSGGGGGGKARPRLRSGPTATVLPTTTQRTSPLLSPVV